MKPRGLSFLLSGASKALESTHDALTREEARAASAARGRTREREKGRKSALTASKSFDRKRRRRASFSAMVPASPLFCRRENLSFSLLRVPCGARTASNRRFFTLSQNNRQRTHLHWGLRGSQPRPPRPARPWRNQFRRVSDRRRSNRRVWILPLGVRLVGLLLLFLSFLCCSDPRSRLPSAVGRGSSAA